MVTPTPGDVNMYVDRLGVVARPRVRTTCGLRGNPRLQMKHQIGPYEPLTWDNRRRGAVAQLVRAEDS
jgi:hypothetical protein